MERAGPAAGGTPPMGAMGLWEALPLVLHMPGACSAGWADLLRPPSLRPMLCADRVHWSHVSLGSPSDGHFWSYLPAA